MQGPRHMQKGRVVSIKILGFFKLTFLLYNFSVLSYAWVLFGFFLMN